MASNVSSPTVATIQWRYDNFIVYCINILAKRGSPNPTRHRCKDLCKKEAGLIKYVFVVYAPTPS